MIDYNIKVCTKCNRELHATSENFYKQKSGKYGLRADCKDCVKKRARKWASENKEKKIKYDREYRRNNRKRLNKYLQQYRAKHRD